MKIIDEKGRLFGKLNLIDLLVIILLIAAVAAVAWKLVGKKAAETVADTGRAITYTVTVEDAKRRSLPRRRSASPSSTIRRSLTPPSPTLPSQTAPTARMSTSP